MHTYMEYLQKCFHKATGWNEDNIFLNITATSQALLEFPIPNGIKLDVSNKATENLASLFTLSNYHSLNGLLAYLYSSAPLRNTMGSKDISLQDAIAGFRIIEPSFAALKGLFLTSYRDLLLYGRMYFPGLALEAMLIKRITKDTQILVKCINNPHLAKNGTMIVYLQKNTPTFLRELIYSTNEALVGFRCLYNFGSTVKKNTQLIPNFDNSVVSIGTELWYAAMTMSPGLSTALRYSTRLTSTGKPLTMTLACNPILGHISLTYNVKTSVSSTFCSKYDFNFFSYASNLSLGFELYNYSKQRKPPLFTEKESQLTLLSTNLFSAPVVQGTIESPPSLRNETEYRPQRQGAVEGTNETVMAAFQNLVNDSDFLSVIKASTSLNDKEVRLLWEGRCKDFLLSTGVKVGLNAVTLAPEFNRFGITLSYAC